MTWNYRIIRRRDSRHLALHEVYYDADGQPWGMTESPATFVCDEDEPPSEIADALGLAMEDAIRNSVLDEPETWPGRAPGDEIEPRQP